MSSGILANIMTFGAAGRVDAAVGEYDRLVQLYQGLYDGLEVRRRTVQHSLSRLVHAKTQAVEALRDLQDVVVGLSAKERLIVQENLPGVAQNAIAQIEGTVRAADMASSAAQGAGAGAATAVGAWALVGAVGSASTGTAISTLSGAAAFNATLAWFGGGALSAGGLGMAGGAAVLGGITLLPMAAVAGVVSHLKANKRIQEIESEAAKVVAAIGEVERAITTTEAIEQRSEEMTRAISRATAGFQSTLGRVERSLHPSNPVLRLWNWFRRKVTGQTYSPGQLKNVAAAGKAASALARMVDQPLLTREGRPT